MDRLRADAAALTGGWRAAGALAECERLGPLMHRLLSGHRIAPPDREEQFRLAYRQSALRNRLLLRELAACLRACARAGIEVIVLKGAALAETLYGDIALRPMLDLDLLVRADDRAAVCRVLHQLGYVQTPASGRSGALDADSDLLFSKLAGATTHVDLHWRLFDLPDHRGGRMDAEWLWCSAQEARIAGVTTLRLGAEAQVLHLAGHLAMADGGPGLLWRNDLVTLLAHHAALDWEALIAGAERHDIAPLLRQVLLELADQWDASIPDRALARLRRLSASRPSPRISQPSPAAAMPPVTAAHGSAPAPAATAAPAAAPPMPARALP
jgi:hypothetical protein